MLRDQNKKKQNIQGGNLSKYSLICLKIFQKMPVAAEAGQIYLHISTVETAMLKADVCQSHLTCPKTDMLPNYTKMCLGHLLGHIWLTNSSWGSTEVGKFPCYVNSINLP